MGERNVHFRLIIHMYAFMGKAVTFEYYNQLKVQSPLLYHLQPLIMNEQLQT